MAHRHGGGGGSGDVRAIDVAPTIAFLMDIPGPVNARGRILYDLFARRFDPGRTDMISPEKL